jgi:hypothetical protein
MKTPLTVAGRLAIVLGLASALSLSSVTFADEASAPASTHIAGTWQSHKYSFQFMGFTSTYSCDGLADKLKKLLLAAGARPDVKAQAGPCASGWGRPDKFARADLTFYTLAPLDISASAVGKTVSGTWRPVTFAAHSPQDLQIGDCELIEQFKSNLLPMFVTRNVVSNTTCVPYQQSGSNIDLRFDSFAAIPAKKSPTASAAPAKPGG